MMMSLVEAKISPVGKLVQGTHGVSKLEGCDTKKDEVQDPVMLFTPQKLAWITTLARKMVRDQTVVNTEGGDVN